MHEHAHEPRDFGRAFAIGIALNTAYVALEAGVGFAIGSLGLLADAGHNASDVLSLIVAWTGAKLAQQAPTERFTYGLSRSPILASLFNALLLFGAMAIVAWEAVRRFDDPAPLPGLTIVWVTLAGLVVNVGTALLFVRGREDLNTRSAYLHMMADAGVTLGVLISGLIIAFTGVLWVDPAVSLLIVGVVLWSTWDLFRDAMRLSLDAVPKGIDPREVRQALEALPDVREVHDLHIWAMSTTQTALTAHLVLDSPAPGVTADLIHRACRELHERFGIEHPTIQLETGETADACAQRPSHAV